MRRSLLFAFALGTLGCAPRLAAFGPEPACAGPQGTACEAAFVDEVRKAPSATWETARASRRGALVDLDRARGGALLAPLFDALVRAGADRAFVLVGGATCEPCEALAKKDAGHGPRRMTIVNATRALLARASDPLRLLAAVARATGTRELVLIDGAEASTLFADDPLAPLMAGAVPRIRVPVTNLARALSQNDAVARAFEAAGAGDYLRAADEVQKLRLSLAATPSDEAELRARDAIYALELAGVALERDPSGTEPPPTTLPVLTSVSGGYAALALLRLYGQAHPSLYAEHRALLERDLSPARFAEVEQRFSPTPACVELAAPSFEEPADLFGATRLAAALDPKAGPGRPARAGALPLSEWLPRHEAARQLAEEQKLAWLVLPALLAERGESAGFEVAGSESWRQLSRLAERHVQSLHALAERHPGSFFATSLGGLAITRGVASDPALARPIAEAFASAIEGRIGAARDPESLLTATLLAGVYALNAPTYVQGPELTALARALGSRLDGDLQKAQGFQVATLHGLRALARLVIGESRPFDELAAGLERSLAKGALADAALGQLARVAVTYAALAYHDELDLAAVEQKSWRKPRSDARTLLAETLRELAPSGPSERGDDELLSALTNYGDALLAASLGTLREPKAETACSSPSTKRSEPLSRAFERAQKMRESLDKKLLKSAHGGDWARRAKLVALVLSDVHDLVNPRRAPNTPRFAVRAADARRVVSEGLAGWLESPLVDAVASTHALARAAAGSSDRLAAFDLVGDGRQVITALARLFHDPAKPSLFEYLDGALSDPRVLATLVTSQLGDGREPHPLVALAEHAYSRGAADHGDILLAASSILAKLGDGDPALGDAALTLAERFERKVALPLLLRSKAVREGTDGTRLARGYAIAVRGECRPPSASAITESELAFAEFRRGDREAALTRLFSVLGRAERDGHVVPRQSFQYSEKSGRVVFKLDLSTSLADGYLRDPSTFNVGLGTETQSSRHTPSATITHDAGDPAKRNDIALRHYAHLALTTSVLARLHGKHDLARDAAHRALASYSTGARLGDTTIPPSSPSAESWPKDSIPTLVLAAQLAVDANEPFLAGSLFGLAARAIDKNASDADVAALLGRLPHALAGLPEVEALVARARPNLTTLVAPLACTAVEGDAQTLERVSCSAYPRALALRLAGAFPKLPRLLPDPPGGNDHCAALQDLDAFLASADVGVFEPALFHKAVASLRRIGHAEDAAVVLSRHRHPKFCSPAVVSHARALGRDASLGSHLRADVLGAAVVCGNDDLSEADVVLLDELTATHPVPLQNFEVLAHAVTLARAGSPGVLVAIASRPDFLDRWRRISPDLSAVALLARALADRLRTSPASDDPAAPTVALLCTSFPADSRAPMCNTVARLRDPKAPPSRADLDAALDGLLATMRSVLEQNTRSSGASP